MNKLDTICPSCETPGGEIGQPCHQKVCGKKGYHYIPRKSYESYRRWLKNNSAPEDPDIGRFIDRFLIVDKLGQGGMGSVYLALQTPLMREVALKIVSGLILDDHSKQRFEREAKAISILYHPNIVSLVDYGFNKANGAPFMALEYIKNSRELSDEIQKRRKKGKRWTREELMNIFTQILNGLSVAHKNGLIHRDIKPQNIMLVDVEGNPHFVKILDFGLSKALGKMQDKSDLTAKGLIMGTPKYIAPEQLAGRDDIDHRADLYSIGNFLFEMITGIPLFKGKDTGQILVRKLKKDFDPMDNLPPGCLQPEIEAFLRKTLASDPGKRFESAADMKDALISTFSKLGELPSTPGDEFFCYAPTMEFKSFNESSGESTTYEVIHEFVTISKPGTKAPGDRAEDEGTAKLPPGKARADPEKMKKLFIGLAVMASLGAALMALVIIFVLYPFFKKTTAEDNVFPEATKVDQTGMEDPFAAGTGKVGRDEPEEAQDRESPGEEGEASSTLSSMSLDFDKIEGNLEDLDKYKHSRVQPTEKQINNVMYNKKLWPKLNACAGKKKGTAVIRVIVLGKTGRVTSAKLLKGKFSGTKEGKCIEKAFKKHVKFTPFKKMEIQITRKYPLK